MSIIQKIFAYNTGSLISGTTQVGDIAISEADVEYSADFGGLQWWGGPDETNGYVIAYPIPGCDRQTPVGLQACFGFKRSIDLTSNSFLQLVNSYILTPPAPFSSATDASLWLTNNGYWNSYPASGVTPSNDFVYITIPNGNLNSEVIVNFPPFPVTPTPTASPVVTTPTPTATTTLTPTPSVTNTQTPTATITGTPTPTPTPTSGAAPSGFTVTIVESGGNVVMTASGTLNVNDLISTGSNIGPFGGGGLGPNTATFVMGTTSVNYDQYSGFTTTPSNFGTGSGLGSSSSSGDIFGVIFQGTPPYQLVVPVGYTTGTAISSTQTFNGQTLSGLGLTTGTYTYTWGSGANADAINVVVGGPSPTPTPTPTSGYTSGGWLFYTPEGVIQGPPSSSGNTIFVGSDGFSTFNPNYTGGTFNIYFNQDNNVGTSYLTQFQGLDTNGGILTISQGSNTVIYSGISSQYNLPGNFLGLSVNNPSQMIQSASTPFVSGTTINVVVS